MEKRILSFMLAVSSALCAVPATATAEDRPYTYNELLEMTDEEVALLRDTPVVFEWQKTYSGCGFGDDSIPDREKFAALFYDDSSPVDLFASWKYEHYMYFLDGQRECYFDIFMADDVELDYNITPGDFGFPENWRIDVNEVIGYGPTGYWPWHAYTVYPTIDDLADFEKYARLTLASTAVTEMYGVKSCSDVFSCYAALGARPYDSGDVNLDYEVNLADAVLIMQSITNPDVYKLSGAARIIGDVVGDDGITMLDAQRIQQFLLGKN